MFRIAAESASPRRGHLLAWVPSPVGLKGLFLVGVAFVLLNAPFWWLGRTSFFYRPWFNLDLLLPILVAARSRVLAVLLLVVLWALDMAVSQSLAWHFHSPWEFIRSIEFAPAIDLASYATLSRIALVALFVLAAVLAVALILRAGRRPPWMPALWVFAAVVAADLFNGSTFLRLQDHRPMAANVATSVARVSIRAMLRPVDALRPLPAGVSLTDRVSVQGWAQTHPDRSVMLVLVESMGLHQDPRMRQWLRAQLIDPSVSRRFDVQEVEVPFHGPTTSAEMRELCGLDGNYRLLDASAAKDCLPNRMASLGWRTSGFHGFSHRMFLRAKWWPAVGVQQPTFAEDMSQRGLADCGGAFHGKCDADVIRLAAHEAAKPRQFVYVLSLNSHLPTPSPTLPADLRAVCGQASAGGDVCNLSALLGTALTEVRRVAADIQPAPLILVVGDHAPPFVELSSRNQFSESSVPGFALIPRD